MARTKKTAVKTGRVAKKRLAGRPTARKTSAAPPRATPPAAAATAAATSRRRAPTATAHTTRTASRTATRKEQEEEEKEIKEEKEEEGKEKEEGAREEEEGARRGPLPAPKTPGKAPRGRPAAADARQTPCLPCVQSALASRSTGQCFNTVGSSQHYWRCSSGHTYSPVPTHVAPSARQLVTALIVSNTTQSPNDYSDPPPQGGGR